MTAWRKTRVRSRQPRKLFELEHGLASDICHRRLNADSAAQVKKRLFVVADGAGEENGLDASKLAISVIASKFNEHRPRTLAKAFRIAHNKLCAHNLQYPLVSTDTESNYGVLERHHKITTATALHVTASGAVHSVHCGDSRLYRFREGQLEQLTTDKHPIPWALGNRFNLTVQRGATEAKHGDIFLLCTDGFHNAATDEHKYAIEKILRNCSKGEISAQRTAQTLVDLAKQFDASDNVTTLIVKVRTS